MGSCTPKRYVKIQKLTKYVQSAPSSNDLENNSDEGAKQAKIKDRIMSVTRLVKKQTKDETFEIFDTVGKINKIDSFFEINDMFDLAMSPQSTSWSLAPSGKWSRHQYGENGLRLVDVQDKIMKVVHSKRNAR